MRICSVVITLVALAISGTESLSKDRFCFLHNNAFPPGRHTLLSHTDSSLSQSDIAKTDDVPQDDETENPLFEFSSAGSEVLVKLHVPVGALWDFIKHVILEVYMSKIETDRPESKFPTTILCCSGGVDSMTLLHSFGLIKNNLSNFVSSNLWTKRVDDKFSNPTEVVFNCLENIFKNFHVFYLNHRVRDDTDEDIKCIRDGCEKYGFDFIVRELGSLPYKVEDGDSDLYPAKGFQDMAHNTRRNHCEELINTLPNVPLSFREVSGLNVTDEHFDMFKLSRGHIRIQNNAKLYHGERELLNDRTKGIVFMGHTLNDNVETVLQKLFRGVHISKLSGMRMVSKLGKNSVIARPFIEITKDELKEFMNKIRGSYHEDYTNNEPKYQRNILRQRLIPELCNFLNTSRNEAPQRQLAKSLNGRFKNLTLQSHATQNMINFEANMFEYYMLKKYGTSCNRRTDFSRTDVSVLNAYYEMYTTISKNNARITNTDEFKNLQRKIAFLGRTGLKDIEIFRVDEWLLIQNRLVREEVFRRYVCAKRRDLELSYRSLHDAVDKIELDPGTPTAKYISFPSIVVAHQNYLIKYARKVSDDLKSEPKLVFSDEYCKFYVRDGINATVKHNEKFGSQKFHLRFLVPVDSKTNPNGISFDIRLIRPEDTVPCKSLWVPTAIALLAKMRFPQILKDEIPVISVSGTNEVACFYGINFNPPYCSKTQEVLFASDKYVKHSERVLEYLISVSSGDAV